MKPTRESVYGLNLAVPEDAKAIIKPWDEREDNSQFVDSGVDDQVRSSLHKKRLEPSAVDGHTYPFHSTRQAQFYTPQTRYDPLSKSCRCLSDRSGRGEVTPRRMRVFANHPNIVDFADAESTKPQLDISLLEGETGVVEYPVRVAAFASIVSLSILLVTCFLYGRCFALTRTLNRRIPWGKTFRGYIIWDLEAK